MAIINIELSDLEPITGSGSTPWATIKTKIQNGSGGDIVEWAPGDYFGGYSEGAPGGQPNLGANSRLVIQNKNNLTFRPKTGTTGQIKIRSFQGFHGIIERCYSDPDVPVFTGPEADGQYRTEGNDTDRSVRTLKFLDCDNITIDGQTRFEFEYGIVLQSSKDQAHEEVFAISPGTNAFAFAKSSGSHSYDIRINDRDQVHDDVLDYGFNVSTSQGLFVPVDGIEIKGCKFTKRGIYCEGGYRIRALSNQFSDLMISEGGGIHFHRCFDCYEENNTVQGIQGVPANLLVRRVNPNTQAVTWPPTPGHDYNEASRHTQFNGWNEVTGLTANGFRKNRFCRGITEDVFSLWNYFHHNTIGIPTADEDGSDTAISLQYVSFGTLIEHNVINGANKCMGLGGTRFNEVAEYFPTGANTIPSGLDKISRYIEFRCNDASSPSNNNIAFNFQGMRDCHFYRNKYNLASSPVVNDTNPTNFKLRVDGYFGVITNRQPNATGPDPNNTWEPYETSISVLPGEAWLKAHQSPDCTAVVTGGFTEFLRDNIIQHFLRGVAYAIPANVRVAFYLTAPALDGTGGVEVSAGNYARLDITFDSPSEGRAANATDLISEAATVDWGAVTALGIISGGEVLMVGSLASPVSVLAGERAVIPAGAFVVNVDP